MIALLYSISVSLKMPHTWATLTHFYYSHTFKKAISEFLKVIKINILFMTMKGWVIRENLPVCHR